MNENMYVYSRVYILFLVGHLWQWNKNKGFGLRIPFILIYLTKEFHYYIKYKVGRKII